MKLGERLYLKIMELEFHPDSHGWVFRDNGRNRFLYRYIRRSFTGACQSWSYKGHHWYRTPKKFAAMLETVAKIKGDWK